VILPKYLFVPCADFLCQGPLSRLAESSKRTHQKAAVSHWQIRTGGKVNKVTVQLTNDVNEAADFAGTIASPLLKPAPDHWRPSESDGMNKMSLWSMSQHLIRRDPADGETLLQTIFTISRGHPA
jgi:hypothetical protein